MHALSEITKHALRCIAQNIAESCHMVNKAGRWQMDGKTKLWCHLLLPLGLQVCHLLLPEVSRAGVHLQHAPLHVGILNLHHTLQLVPSPVQCSQRHLPHQGLLYIWQSSTHSCHIVPCQPTSPMTKVLFKHIPAPKPIISVRTMQVCYSNIGCKAIANYVAHT